MKFLLLCILVLLPGCGPKRDTTKIEYIDRVVETQVALDPRLTTLPVTPTDPAFNCKDSRGQATVCSEDSLDWGQQWRRVATDVINQLREIAGLQPKQ